MITLERVNDYLTSDEAAQLLGCSKRTLRRYVSQGLLSKMGTGRNSRYSAESVLHLASTKGKSKLDKVITQLSSIAHTQQLILARLSLIESVFFAHSPKVTLSNEQVIDLRASIRRDLRLSSIDFSTCSDWSTDLLRLSEESIKLVGRELLKGLINRLIISAESSAEIREAPSKRVVVDRLRWVKSSVESGHRA